MTVQTPTILVVDDEEGIRQLVKVFLERYHFHVLEASNGAELFDLLEKNAVDLVLLDLMLPDIYGIDACKKIRETSQVPVIMLTAVQGETNTVLGFEAGADDYIEKPFSAHVLLSRIKAVMKRSDGSPEPIQHIEGEAGIPIPNYSRAYFGQWVYFPEDDCLKHSSGKHVFLTRNETILMKLFLSNPEHVLTRDRIALILKLDLYDTESRAIDVQISRLRNKLRDKTQNNMIRSIRNKGYLLVAPVRLSS